MNKLYALAIAMIFSLPNSIASSKNADRKISLIGKVSCINSARAIRSSVVIRGQGVNVVVDTDVEGKFTTSFTRVSTFNIIIQAAGFEKQELVFSVPTLKSDSTIHVSAQLTPIEKMKLHGMILDKKTSKPIKAEFDLYLDNDMVKEGVEIAEHGNYGETLTNFGWYIITVSARGYLNLTDTIWVMNCKRPELKRDYYLTPIEAGLTVRLKNIQFNFGKTTLHPDSYTELNDVVELLQKNPGLKLEIGGHTDSDGPDNYNLWLSQARAQAVVNYMISQGAIAEQLTAKGYGETKPIDTADTQLAKSTNRRVEFMVLEN